MEDVTSKKTATPAARTGAILAGCVAAGAALLTLSARRSGRSVRGQALSGVVLPLVRRSGKASTPDGQAARLAANREAGEALPPADLRRRFRFDEQAVEGSRVFALRQKSEGGGLHILYLHGGEFELHLRPQHWTILGGLADRLPADVTIPLYPLAPEHDHRPA